MLSPDDAPRFCGRAHGPVCARIENTPRIYNIAIFGSPSPFSLSEVLVAKCVRGPHRRLTAAAVHVIIIGTRTMFNVNRVHVIILPGAAPPFSPPPLLENHDGDWRPVPREPSLVSLWLSVYKSKQESDRHWHDSRNITLSCRLPIASP